MTDSVTHKPIRVLEGGNGGPYIIVPVEKRERVESLLRGAGVAFWVDLQSISVNGGPYEIFVNLRQGTDEKRVQEILDRDE